MIAIETNVTRKNQTKPNQTIQTEQQVMNKQTKQIINTKSQNAKTNEMRKKNKKKQSIRDRMGVTPVLLWITEKLISIKHTHTYT